MLAKRNEDGSVTVVDGECVTVIDKGEVETFCAWEGFALHEDAVTSNTVADVVRGLIAHEEIDAKIRKREPPDMNEEFETVHQKINIPRGRKKR